jgi:hypothetical protein
MGSIEGLRAREGLAGSRQPCLVRAGFQNPGYVSDKVFVEGMMTLDPIIDAPTEEYGILNRFARLVE